MVGASVLEGNFLIILTAFSFIYNLSDLAKGDAWETACNATCMGHACHLHAHLSPAHPKRPLDHLGLREIPKNFINDWNSNLKGIKLAS